MIININIFSMTMILFQVGGGSAYSRVSALGSVGTCKPHHCQWLSTFLPLSLSWYWHLQISPLSVTFHFHLIITFRVFTFTFMFYFLSCLSNLWTFTTELGAPAPVHSQSIVFKFHPNFTWWWFILDQVSPDKYCQLVEEEGGLALVEEIVNNNRWIDKKNNNNNNNKSYKFWEYGAISKWQQVEMRLSISGEEESEPNQEQVKSLALKVRWLNIYKFI